MKDIVHDQILVLFNINYIFVYYLDVHLIVFYLKLIVLSTVR